MTQWGNKYYAGDAGPPILLEHTRCSQDFTPEVRCSECGEAVTPWEVKARARPERPGVPPVRRGPIQEKDGPSS